MLLGGAICETDPVKSKLIHAALRNNREGQRTCPSLHIAPGRVYNPPLGRPGLLTSQLEAGHLALHRRLKIHPGTEGTLFDEVYGYGWCLLNIGNRSVQSRLSKESQQFFVDTLRGQCVNVSAEEDSDGEYHNWFAKHMGLDHVVLIRPDFYVFGHAPMDDVEELVDDLRQKLGSGTGSCL